MRKNKVVVLPGDGVGSEVVSSACEYSGVVNPQLKYETYAFGGAAIDTEGEPQSPAMLKVCRGADAVLLGANGGRQLESSKPRREVGSLALRKELGSYANIRPIKALARVTSAPSPLRPELVADVDMVIVRELTGGIYFGEPRRRREESAGEEKAIDTGEYPTSTVKRIAGLAFRLAKERRKLVVSVDKAKVLETSRLWRDVVTEVQTTIFTDICLSHQSLNSSAMRLLRDASTFDVLLTNNMFGEILSDEASELIGPIGVLSSASVGDGQLGVYEPIPGSVPDIAGEEVVNPVGTILGAAWMPRSSLDEPKAAIWI